MSADTETGLPALSGTPPCSPHSPQVINYTASESGQLGCKTAEVLNQYFLFLHIDVYLFYSLILFILVCKCIIVAFFHFAICTGGNKAL